jgi:hypothetical protein
MKKKIKTELYWVFFSILTVVLLMEIFVSRRKRTCKTFIIDNGRIIHRVNYEGVYEFFDQIDCPECNPKNN